MRVGIGYDVHRLAEGRKLILGGVNIPFEKGLIGHSDADVLIHSVCDALLGAANLGDIGRHFPDNDIEYKGISSLILLNRVAGLISEAGYKVLNLDSCIAAQRPKLSPYITKMATNIAQALNINSNQVSIKATTTEGLGFEGREEGISVQTIVLIAENNAKY